MKIFTGFQARSGFENASQVFIGCSWISGGLKDNDCARPEIRSNCTACLQNEGNVGLAVLIKRRRNTDKHRVNLLHTSKIRGGCQAARLHLLRHRFRWNMFDVTAPLVERVHLVWVNVKTKNLHVGARKLEAQGQSNVTKTY